MQIGIIGLGRMGGNIARRLMRHGHEVIVHDRDSNAVAALASDGATGVAGIQQLVHKLSPPRAVWMMLPAGEITEAEIARLAALLEPGDVILDGGNSFWKDDIRRAATLKGRNIHYLDVGTSGGVWGLERGYIHAGPSGAGHFVKMVHNGIEYGLMQAYAEGFDILKNAGSEALPVAERFDLDVTDIAEVWRRGSVIASWLLDLSASALAQDPELAAYSGFVEDSGEGRWTIMAAIDEAVPADVLSAALYARFRSRQGHTFAEKVLSAMRKGFGGHVEPEARHP